MEDTDTCYFCRKSFTGTKNILNTCPRCNVRYCSETCYKNVQHLQCTEAFYRQCVEQELRGTKAENRREFIDKLRRQMENNDQLDSDDDSDDDDDEGDNSSSTTNDNRKSNDDVPHYLKQLESLNLDEIDEDDLDEQLKAMGVGNDPNNLITILNDEERRFLHEFMNRK